MMNKKNTTQINEEKKVKYVLIQSCQNGKGVNKKKTKVINKARTTAIRLSSIECCKTTGKSKNKMKKN
jgi:transcriptional regulatory protein LevR